MISTFFDNMGLAINAMARPVDAIKHQAKTVTVGTSRISETFEGMVFDALTAHKLQVSQLTNKNVLVIKNLQEIISEIKGALLYRVTGLNLLAGSPRTRALKSCPRTAPWNMKPPEWKPTAGSRGRKTLLSEKATSISERGARTAGVSW